jgi:hypothetical protein
MAVHLAGMAADLAGMSADLAGMSAVFSDTPRMFSGMSGRTADKWGAAPLYGTDMRIAAPRF